MSTENRVLIFFELNLKINLKKKNASLLHQ